MEDKYQQDCSNNHCKIMVEFSLMGDYDNIEEISKDLKIDATKIRKKNDYKIKEFAEDSWTISTGYQNVLSVSEAFNQLIRILEGKENLINQIKELNKLDSVFIVIVDASIHKMPEYILTKGIINFASYIDTEIHFDNYLD